MPGLDSIRIQRALVDLANNGPYYAVAYDTPATDGPRKQSVIDTDIATPVTPRAVLANEVTSSFGVDSNYGRDLRLARDSWTWAVIVAFNQEVTAEAAERAWAASPQILPRDADHDYQITLYISEVRYLHPTIAEGEGTRLDITFEARLSRR